MDKKITNQAETLLPTEWGNFVLSAYTDHNGDPMPHIVLAHPDYNPAQAVPVRIHSECLTGDIFHSLKCDCGAQLSASMTIIAQQAGVLIYLRQEGRGIGIINKIKAYRHQEAGLDTIEANEALGLGIDMRDYTIAAEILQDLGISTIQLITNNPAKISGIEAHDITVAGRIPIEIKANQKNKSYLMTKKKRMGHWLDLDE